MNKKGNRKTTPISYDSIIETRPRSEITLRVMLSSTSLNPIPWDGFVVPCETLGKQLVGPTLRSPANFRLSVYGASQPRGEPWKYACNKCKQHEYERRYKRKPSSQELDGFHVPVIGFDLRRPSIVLQDGSADIDVHFQCYPSHNAASESKFKYVSSASRVDLLTSQQGRR